MAMKWMANSKRRTQQQFKDKGGKQKWKRSSTEDDIRRGPLREEGGRYLEILDKSRVSRVFIVHISDKVFLSMVGRKRFLDRKSVV